jgi:biopolymer transport protein ExbD
MRAREDQFSEEEVDVQMTPMIDCVFLLLVFFLCSSTMTKPHKDLNMALCNSSASQVVASKYATLIIEVDKNGDIYIDSEPMTTRLLHRRLEKAVRENPTRPIRVDSDRQTPVAYVAELLDHLQFIGFNNVGIRTRD